MLAIDVLIKVRTRVYIGRNVCWPRQGTASKDNIILLGQQHTDRQVGQTDRQTERHQTDTFRFLLETRPAVKR